VAPRAPFAGAVELGTFTLTGITPGNEICHPSLRAG